MADRFDLRRDISLNTTVTAARFDETASRWQVTTDRGAEVSARFLIIATGCLSATREPDFPGLESFRGKSYHTGRWPHEKVDFSGQRVGIIGTGSSGIQAIPVIAQQAARLVVFQRTPNFSIPAWNKKLPDDLQREWKAIYPEHRRRAPDTRSGVEYEYSSRSAMEVSAEEREREFEKRWARGGANFTHSFNDIFFSQQANDTAAEFVRDEIRSIVRDPAVAEMLAPRDHPIGTKRICVDTDYYATFNRDNVTLVDVRPAPVEAITPTGLRTREADYGLDSIAFATGYDAVTGRRPHSAYQGEFLVHGREHPRQAARIPSLCWRLRCLSAHLHRSGRGGLPGLRPAMTDRPRGACPALSPTETSHMPDEIRPHSIADMPAQLAASPTSPAEARGRFFNTGNAFNIKLPPVPDRIFTDEACTALDPATPTGLISCDISGELACAFPATTPLVLAHYAKIRTGETLTTDFAASGVIAYVIQGSGTTRCAMETIAWDTGDLFVLPGGVTATHQAAEADAVLWIVTNEPQLAFENLRPPAPGHAPTEIVHYRAGEIARQIEMIYEIGRDQ
ncbi:MAG: NAD(P)-binding domain-containing protein, partial [Candidatus Tumulicola sp.]